MYPLAESVNRVGGFLVYRDVKEGRNLYILITKYCEGEVAKYHVLKESLLRVKEHASSLGNSKLAMPRIGCVDDELEWVNVAICLEVLFQDSYFTISVYTPRDQEQSYASPSARRGTSRSSRFDSACSVDTLEEILVSEQVELWSNWDHLALANRVLYRKWKPSNRGH